MGKFLIVAVLLSIFIIAAGWIFFGPGNADKSPASTVTPQPIANVTATDWGTDKTTYARGDTATGWVSITNTGNVPVDQINFTIVIKTTFFFVPVSRTYSYSSTGLDIQPGERRRVQFSQAIPSEYNGMSTAGDYQLDVTASLAGNAFSTYSESIKVV